MRGFVVVFLLGLIICGCVFAQTEKQAAPKAAPPGSNPTVHTFTFTLPNSTGTSEIQNAPVHPNPEWLPPLSLTPNPPKVHTNLIPYDNAYLFGGASCFTMRTYMVRQESAKSDVTVPSGYTECMPASRLKLKNAVPDKTEQK